MKVPHPHRSGTTPRRVPAPLALALGVALLGAGGARAQSGPIEDARRQANIIEQQQRERLREAQERALPPPAAPGGADVRGMQPRVDLPGIGPGCHQVQELRIEGATLLPAARRAELVRDYAGRCLAAADIQSLLALLTKDYVDRGYITTRAYLPAQDLATGVLTLRVLEGTIERYRLVEDGRQVGGLSIPGAFPAPPGGPVNLRDLEQGLEQINNLRSNTARVDLEPGTEPGQSVVVVHNHAERPVRLQVSYDNLGSPNTGRDNFAASLSLESLLGFNELVVLTRNQTVPEGSNRADGTALLVSVPWGYSTIGLDASRSDYTTGLALPSGAELESSGSTTNYGLSLSHVVLRNQTSRAAVSARLATSDSRNFLAGQLLSVSSRKLATFTLGVAGYTQWGGGVLNGGVAYVRGLDALGALSDLPGTPDDFPHAQFDKFTLDLGLRYPVQVAGVQLQWNSQVAAQYSRQTLYGSQQFLVGSPATVRGTRINSLSGDNGALWRNDLSWPWQAGPVRGAVYAGWDIGKVDNHVEQGLTGSMTGATVGVAGQWKNVGFELFAARAAHLPAFMTPEGTQFGVRLSSTF
jgi:hemolysin activation/secretion protein